MLNKYYYNPHPRVLSVLKHFVKKDSLILDLGPYERPLSFATDYIDIKKFSEIPDNKKFHFVDITKEDLPYKDNEVDFLYCRHVLEDIINPTRVLKEIQRVAKIGYIETPSPIAEYCKFINGKSELYRGYDHHRYIIWMNKNNVLNILPKLPFIEQLTFNDNLIYTLLNADQKYWNTYCFWCESFPEINKISLNGDNFVIQNYQRLVNLAFEESIEHINNQVLLNPPSLKINK